MSHLDDKSNLCVPQRVGPVADLDAAPPSAVARKFVQNAAGDSICTRRPVTGCSNASDSAWSMSRLSALP